MNMKPHFFFFLYRNFLKKKMNLKPLISAIFVITTTFAAPASKQQFTKLVVFGDSYSGKISILKILKIKLFLKKNLFFFLFFFNRQWKRIQVNKLYMAIIIIIIFRR